MIILHLTTVSYLQTDSFATTTAVGLNFTQDPSNHWRVSSSTTHITRPTKITSQLIMHLGNIECRQKGFADTRASQIWKFPPEIGGFLCSCAFVSALCFCVVLVLFFRISVCDPSKPLQEFCIADSPSVLSNLLNRICNRIGHLLPKWVAYSAFLHTLPKVNILANVPQSPHSEWSNFTTFAL